MGSKETLKRMTRREKISFLSGSGTYNTKALPKRGIPSIFMCDGPHGIRKRVGSNQTENLIHESAASVCYPSLSTLANSWDVSLLYQAGEAVGTDAQVKDVQIVLGPGVNIKRNPLCGRNFEYFSEDPLLSGKLGAAWIRGLQSKGVGASVKHYCCNNQETNRMTVSSELDERTLREIYLKPFEIAVKEAEPVSLMCSYNRINGDYASDSVRLMNDILRGEWGYRGVTLTDWAAMSDRVAGVRARLTLEMPDSLGYFDDSVQKALAAGEITGEDLDACLSPLLQAVLELHQKRQPQFDANERQHAFARVAAAQSAVLLKNDGTLPLKAGERICVVGPFATHSRYQGTGSSRVNAYRVDTLLDALDELGVAYAYTPGFALDSEEHAVLQQEALKAASDCDVILLALGLPETYESEGFDRDHMNLPKVQDDLVMEMSQLGKSIAVVLFSGGAVETPWADAVNALLHMGLGGEASGGACADVLLGRVNPSGKLAESWPVSYRDHITSTFWLEDPLQAFYREGLFVGYRYFDTVQAPVRFAFGHGLSYTMFEYSELSVTETATDFDITLTVRNMGDKPGAEVVQLYLHAENGHVVKPDQELKAFAKVMLDAGESQQVHFRLDRAAFSHFVTQTNNWKTEKGQYEIRIGASSRDIRLTKRVTIAFGTDFPETDSGWYSSRVGVPAISDLERLCGHAIARRTPYRRGTYDAGATLGEMAGDSWLARIILAAGRSTIAKGLGIKPDDTNPEFRMMVATASASPLRSLALSAPTAMTKGLIKLILHTANKGCR